MISYDKRQHKSNTVVDYNINKKEKTLAKYKIKLLI